MMMMMRDESDDDNEVEDEIMEKFIRSFNSGDYDAEFEDSLYSNQALTPTFLPTQASYNKPDNWVERNRNGLEIVKERLQICIDRWSHDRGFDLVLKYNNQWDPINEEPIVWHEPILDEYWNKLEAKIDRKKQLGIVTKMDHIEITNVEMKKEHLDPFVAIFISGRATNLSDTVHFDNVNLCGEGIISLSKLVDVSSKLRMLHLHHNRIDNMDSARCLSRSLNLHHRITHLQLAHCDLGSSPEILSVILQSDVRHINLSNNNIDSLGAVKIAEYLGDDPPIHRINLYDNRLNDDDAILISQALKMNRNLTHLHLEGNDLTSIGVKVLLTSVYDGSSLNAISQSNHTLQQFFQNSWMYLSIASIGSCTENCACLA